MTPVQALKGGAPSPLSRRGFLRTTVGQVTGLTAAGALGLLCPCCRAGAVAMAADGERPFREVAPGVFVREGAQEEMTAANLGAIANTGFIIGRDSVAVVDTGTCEAHGLALRRAAEAVTERPISHVIATHVHPDHCFGHSAFADLPAVTLGHQNLPRALAERGPFYAELLHRISPDFGAPGYVTPAETVADIRRIDLGDRPLVLKAWGAAHTDNDLTVFDEREGVLWTGDLLFSGRLPTVDGSLLGWLEVHDSLLGPDVKTAVPGHGPVDDGRAALAAQRAYLAELRDRVRLALDEGQDLTGAVRTLTEESAAVGGGAEDWLLYDDNHGRNVVAAYTELEWE